MKTTIIGLLFLLFLVPGYSQNLSYYVHGKYKHPVKKEALNKAATISDIIPYYPASWMDSYISAEVSSISNGNTLTATTSNDIFSEEQIKMISSLVFGDEIIINIKYKFKNPVTGNIEIGSMNYSATVVPETEAAYSGGYEQLSQYIKENAIDKISPDDSKDLQQAVVSFTINEEGEIADAKISRTSGYPETDKLLVKAIMNMPRWKPAEDSKGIKVKQDFEFSVEAGGC